LFFCGCGTDAVNIGFRAGRRRREYSKELQVVAANVS
jgi:acetylornithine/succinyldiaminopimelate/putrescine aminotransferase